MAQAKIGRPRSEKSRDAIINATHELLVETNGSGLTIEAIARRAEVGKPTLYRWWPSLADIVLEVLLRQADSEIPIPNFETLRDTLRQFLRESMNALDWCGIHLRFLMAQAQKDAAFRERFRENFVARRREVLNSIFAQAAKRGQIDHERNLDLMVDMVFGTMWYRLLTGHAQMDESFADELTEAVIVLVQDTPAC